MKSVRSFFVAGLALASLGISNLAPGQEKEIDCRPVVENFRRNVEASPEHVLTHLEDALIANGGHCVPQFVQAAIEASNAKPPTVKKIVFVAVTNAEKQAAEIAEAAVAANPKYADAVREGFAEAFEDSNPRLKPSAPAEQPAWAEENAPVPEPTLIPAPPADLPPIPQTGPVEEKPAIARTDPSESTAPPAIAGSPVPTPVPRQDAGWDLLHDGEVEPISPDVLRPTVNSPPNLAMADAVEPEIPGAEKKKFPFRLPKIGLPPLPKPRLPEFEMPEVKLPEVKLPEIKMPEFAKPELPEANAPIDLLLTGPFSGIPPGIEPAPELPPVLAEAETEPKSGGIAPEGS